MRSGLSLSAAAVCVALATQACAQADPFGSLYGGGSRPAAAPARDTVGRTSASGNVGLSYAGHETGGANLSLRQIDMLPKSIPPIVPTFVPFSQKYIKLRPRVAVASYGFGFTQALSATATAMGRGSDLTPRRSTIALRLVGFTDDLGQTLADEAYADLVSRLKAAGYDVASAEEMKAAATFAALPAYSGPNAIGGAGTSGKIVYGPRSGVLLRGYGFEQGLAAMTPATLIGLGKASAELNAVMLTPRLLIDFARMESSGRSNWTANASVGAELRFRINEASRADYVAANERAGSMPGGWSLKSGAGTDELFGVMTEADDRSDSVVLHNAFAAAGLGSIYRQSLIYDVTISQARYAALARAAYQGFNAALVEQIKAAKAP